MTWKSSLDHILQASPNQPIKDKLSIGVKYKLPLPINVSSIMFVIRKFVKILRSVWNTKEKTSQSQGIVSLLNEKDNHPIYVYSYSRATLICRGWRDQIDRSFLKDVVLAVIIMPPSVKIDETKTTLKEIGNLWKLCCSSLYLIQMFISG